MTAAILVVFYAVMAVSLLFAWFKGGNVERIAAAMLVGFFLFRLILRPLIPASFEEIDPLAFAQDLIGFAGFVWIGLKARRYWPLLAAALQLLSLSAHFARVVQVAIDPRVYAVMKSLPTFLVFVLLAVGTASYRSRLRRTMRSGPFRVSPGAATVPSWRRASTNCRRHPSKHS